MKRYKRVKDRKVIKACRKDYCEVCGRVAMSEPHHIFSVGSGGGDIKENLIQLCSECHVKTHAGNVDKNVLLRVVALREDSAVEELYKINRTAMGY